MPPAPVSERFRNYPEPDIALAEHLFSRLAEATRDKQGVTRAAYGAGEQFAHDLVAEHARQAGLDVAADAGGNLYMTLRGTGDARRTILIGSHLDSVPMGGNFDGAAGVLAGLAILTAFAKAGLRFSDDLAVIAIRAEESNWFPFSYVGSKAALGLLPPEALDVRRSDTGRTLADHMAALGFDPAAMRAGVRQIKPETIRAYIELHIEQGPVLIDNDQPVALVTGIRGSFRYREARVLGEEAHSGAVSRAYRRDAVIGAADLVMRLHNEWIAQEAEGHDLTVTFGQFFTPAESHAFSKVSGEVGLAIDVRSHSEATLSNFRDRVHRHVKAVEADQRIRFELGPLTGSKPALMDEKLLEIFGDAMEKVDVKRFSMASGAGHDAAVFAGAGVPSLMLFVRNQNGSHNPHEAMEMADFAVAAKVMAEGLVRLAGS